MFYILHVLVTSAFRPESDNIYCHEDFSDTKAILLSNYHEISQHGFHRLVCFSFLFNQPRVLQFRCIISKNESKWSLTHQDGGKQLYLRIIILEQPLFMKVMQLLQIFLNAKIARLAKASSRTEFHLIRMANKKSVRLL